MASIADTLKRLAVRGEPDADGARLSAAELSALAARMDALEAQAQLSAIDLGEGADRDALYAAYHRVSSLETRKADAAVEGAAARRVWETGGDAGAEHKKSHSHWRDSRVFADRFEAWGQRCLSMVKRHPRFDPARTDLTVAEYGPGGGAVLRAFAPHAARFVGFDVSQSNLDETARVLAETDRPFQARLVPDDFAALAPMTAEIDLFLSFNVFQHLPSKGYLRDILWYMARAMRGNAIGVVDIRFDNGDPKFAGAALADYGTVTGHTFATSVRIDHFNAMLEQTGFVVEFIGALTKANGATFWFTRR